MYLIINMLYYLDSNTIYADSLLLRYGVLDGMVLCWVFIQIPKYFLF